jgi:hypothetical protein
MHRKSAHSVRPHQLAAAVLLLLLVLAVKPLADGAFAATSQQLLITPTALEFGEVSVGTTSPQQIVTITNMGAVPLEMSGVGGAPGAPFNAVQNCQGTTLAPGASCEMFYSFTPTEPGPANSISSGAWNGIPFNISLSGAGVSPYDFVGFAPPLDRDRSFTVGSRMPVRFALLDGTGQPVASNEAADFAATCSVVVTFTGDPGILGGRGAAVESPDVV